MKKMNVNVLLMIIFILIVIASGCTPALHKAARDNDVNKIDLLLHKSHRVDELSDIGYGYTPLHYAAANGSMKALEYLLEKGADINARGSANITPLHAACGLLVPLRPGNGSSEAAIYLINRGADSFIIDGFSYTPIHYASANGRLDVIKAFLNKGVDIDIGNGTIGTPLHSAFQFFSPIQQALTTADYLIKNGADINATSADGSTPLHNATSIACEWVKFLVEHGADINKPNNKGETPLSLIKTLCPNEIP